MEMGNTPCLFYCPIHKAVNRWGVCLKVQDNKTKKKGEYKRTALVSFCLTYAPLIMSLFEKVFLNYFSNVSHGSDCCGKPCPHIRGHYLKNFFYGAWAWLLENSVCVTGNWGFWLVPVPLTTSFRVQTLLMPTCIRRKMADRTKIVLVLTRVPSRTDKCTCSLPLYWGRRLLLSTIYYSVIFTSNQTSLSAHKNDSP